MDEIKFRMEVAITLYTKVNHESDYHVIPQDDWFDHIEDVNCVCGPKLDPQNQKEKRMGRAVFDVWVHHQIKWSRENCH